MPTATDLVTDLPADFEVFGQAVATSMADLLGGTTGQILAKASATDMDFTWIANDQGDITGVTAGNGISVTSPTGPVPTVAIDTAVTVDKTTAQTLTNKTLTSPALTTPTISTATTNGDLLYGTGSGAITRLGIGSSAQVLTVAAGVPSWATPASGSTFVGAYAYSNNSSQTIPGTTSTTLLLPSELYDTDSFHSTSSNTSRMTVPSGKAGKYLITAGAYLAGYTGGYARFRVFQNGTEISNYGLTSGQISALWDGAQYPLVQANLMVSAAVSDYYEIGWYNQNGSQANTYAFFGFSYLGA